MLGWYNNCSSDSKIGLRRQGRCYLSFDSFWQLSLVVMAISSAHYLPEETRLSAPLGCLVAMLIIARVDRNRLDRAIAREKFLGSDMDRALSKGTIAITGHNLFLFEKGE